MRISDWSSDVCSSDLRASTPPSKASAAPLHGVGVGRGGRHAKAWSEREACANEDGATAALGKAPDPSVHFEDGGGLGASGGATAPHRPLHHQGFPPVIRTLNSLLQGEDRKSTRLKSSH